jgi:hypothetical protein
MVYSHPLGLLMLVALSLAGLFDLRRTFGGVWSWLAVHLAAALLVSPWIGNYFDHPPEFLLERLPLRFLLGTPIGFIGGNRLLLLGMVALVAFAMIGRFRESAAVNRLSIPNYFLCWLIVPPVALYVYSWLFHPVFGPARYTVFVAPAYLVLVAWGLGRLPPPARYPLGMALALFSFQALVPLAYDPEQKADWRAFAAEIAVQRAVQPKRTTLVIVASADPNRNVEVETARYYLPAGCEVVGASEDTAKLTDAESADLVYFARGGPISRVSGAPDSIGPFRRGEVSRYPGLSVYRFVR